MSYARNKIPHESKPAPAASDKESESRKEPESSFLQFITGWFKNNFRTRNGDNSLKEALEEVLEEHDDEASLLAPEEKNMIRNMLSFGELDVRDIMTPRTDIMAIEHTVTLQELIAHVAEQGHTRIPVYEGTLDSIKGFIHVKDLIPMLTGSREFSLPSVMREILFVPPSMKIVDLLLRMRLSGVHMAIVVDEYGGTDGLVTLEDLFEEIVGDIQDEHDEEEAATPIARIGDHTYDADARIRMNDVEALLGLNLQSEEDDFDTLGGLLFAHLGRVPAKGEKIAHSCGVTFEILDADPRRIRKIRLHHVPTPSTEEAMTSQA